MPGSRIARRGGQVGAWVATLGLGLVTLFSLLESSRARAAATEARLAGANVHRLLDLRDAMADHSSAEARWAATAGDGYLSLVHAARLRLDTALAGLDRFEGDAPARHLAGEVRLLIATRLLAADAITVNGRMLADLVSDQAIHGSVEGLVRRQQDRLDEAAATQALANARGWALNLAALLLALVLGVSLTQLARLHLAQRTLAEQALAQTSTELRLLVDHAPLALVVIDPDGTVREWNAGAQHLFGWAAFEVLGQRVPVVPPEGLADAQALWAQVAAGEHVQGREMVRLRKDGSRVPVAVSAAPVFQPGHPPRLMFIYLNLTERQQADREVAEARERAEAATRAKSAFLATMSHEIRTPMNGVLGMAELLLHEDLAPAQREMVDTIHRSGAHLLGVLNDILDFSKVEAGKLTLEAIPFDPTRATRDVVALLRAAAEAKGLALLFRAEPGTPAAVLGDPGRVRQVLTNFIGNAIKFTREGTIWVTLGPAGASGGLRLAVRDTGIGIPADRLDAVFESFAQAHTSTAREYGGTGLGLAICRQLAELMGGRVGVESTPGAGSTFWCELPLPTHTETAPVAAAPVRAAAAAPATVAGTRVLLADDTSVNLAVATRMLKKLGCRVDTAVDGAEALAKARAGGYDLVLLDCHMPVLDGFGAARGIRALAGEMAQVPIVALTASVTAEEHRLCREAGMDGVLAKPVTIEQLRELLAERTAPAAPAG